MHRPRAPRLGGVERSRGLHREIPLGSDRLPCSSGHTHDQLPMVMPDYELGGSLESNLAASAPRGMVTRRSPGFIGPRRSPIQELQSRAP